MIPTEIIILLESKQIWELSDADLERVKNTALVLQRKAETEQQFRHMADESKRCDYMAVLNEGSY